MNERKKICQKICIGVIYIIDTMYGSKKPWRDDNFIQMPVSDDNEGELVWKVVHHSECMLYDKGMGRDYIECHK